MDPMSLRVQAVAARFLLGAFPVRWRSVVVVDAPYSFGAIWRAARLFLSAAFADSVQFVYQPDAAAHCERTFGRPIL